MAGGRFGAWRDHEEAFRAYVDAALLLNAELNLKSFEHQIAFLHLEVDLLRDEPRVGLPELAMLMWSAGRLAPFVEGIF